MAKYNSYVAVFAYLALLISIVLMVSTAESRLLENAFGEEQNISITTCVKVYGAEAGDTCSLIIQKLSVPQDFFFTINPNLNCNTIFGCDASVLLDDTANFTGEKTARPNNNSLRGFEIIDNIKTQLESLCPGVVSCADILAIAARDSVVALGGQSWTVQLGRRDSTTASLAAANSEIPSPLLNLSGLIISFSNKGFTLNEMVALSGAHTIGHARCRMFRARLYNETNNIDSAFAASLRSKCPITVGEGDDNLSPLDSTTPNTFDNNYFNNLIMEKGLLHSDQQLWNNGSTDSQVLAYVINQGSFFADFANAMVKMGNLSPLTGISNGQIRTNCRNLN